MESSRIHFNINEGDTLVEEEVTQVQESQPWQTGIFHSPNTNDNDDDPTNLRRSTRVRRPNPRYANASIVESNTCEPKSFKQSSTKQEWVQAMEEEMAALIRNRTWELVPKPTGVKPISCKWVYKVKRKVNGSIERFKARLVARGFSQQIGLNYEDKFSPVAKLTTIRVLLALAVSKGWTLWKMDVSKTFLYGDLDHVIHMEQPMGFESTKYPNYVCKLKKALYGLKQSPRAWFGKIVEFLEHNGFIITTDDASLFVKTIGDKVAVVLVYVDDLIITSDLVEVITLLKENLCTRFHTKDLGKL